MSHAFLEYIESTGIQFINTGVRPSGRHRVQMRCRVTTPTTNWDTLFGTRNGNNARFTLRYVNTVNGILEMQKSAGTSGGYQYNRPGIVKNAEGQEWHTFDMNGTLFYVDGELKGTFNAGTDEAFPFVLYLFALDEANAAIDFALMQMASCRIWDGSGNLVRDFFPCRDDVDRVCLYDAVTNQHYYNAGSGNFVAGPELDSYLVRFSDCGSWGAGQLIPCGEETALDPNTFSKTDYIWSGWDTKITGETAVYSDGDTVKDIAGQGEIKPLYAVWRMAWAWLFRDANGKWYSAAAEMTEEGIVQHREEIEAVTELGKDAFQDNGFQFIPDSGLLNDLDSPTVYRWDMYNGVSIQAVLQAVPLVPQVVIFSTMTLGASVKYINIAGDDDALWNVSFDGGQNWYKYNNGWIRVTASGDGCVKRKLEILTASEWAEKVNGTLRFRCWLVAGSWVKRIRVDY